MKSIISTLLLGAVCGLAPAALAITSSDEAGILFIKQEEKLARDVYQALAAQWNHATFANIALSEQRHMDAVDGLIQRFGLSDFTPVEPGVFSVPELQALYDELLVQGSQSLADALAVGVLIEETDIADLDEILNTTGDWFVQRVLTNLQRGSNHHLDAFNASLAALNDPTSATGNCDPTCAGNPANRKVGGPGARNAVAPRPGRR